MFDVNDFMSSHKPFKTYKNRIKGSKQSVIYRYYPGLVIRQYIGEGTKNMVYVRFDEDKSKWIRYAI